MLTSPKGNIYIGQTTRPIHKRLQEHETGKSKDCRAIYNAIQFYGWENIEKDWYYCPDEDLNDHEELMVEVLGTLTPEGYNLKEGGGNGKLSEETKQMIGDGNRGVPKSEEHRQRISEATLGEKNHNFGKPKNEETRQKMSDAQLGEKNHMWGQHHSEESRQKMSESRQNVSNETRQKMSEARLGEKHYKSKRVYQYDIDSTFIDSFGSVGEAGRHLNKTDGSIIAKCARGERKTAYNYKWSYMLNIFI